MGKVRITGDRDWAGGRRNAGIPVWAGELSLQRRECFNEFRIFEGPVAPAHIDLHHDSGFHKTGNRQIRCLKPPASQLGRSTRGQYGGRGKLFYDQADRGVTPGIASPFRLGGLELLHLLL